MRHVWQMEMDLILLQTLDCVRCNINIYRKNHTPPSFHLQIYDILLSLSLIFWSIRFYIVLFLKLFLIYFSMLDDIFSWKSIGHSFLEIREILYKATRRLLKAIYNIWKYIKKKIKGQPFGVSLSEPVAIYDIRFIP